MNDVKTFISIAKKIFIILDKKQKKQVLFVLGIIIIAAGFEMLGISCILPFVQAVSNPSGIEDKAYIKIIIGIFGITDSKQLLLIIGVGIIIVYLIKNLVLTFSSFVQIKFKTKLYINLSTLLMQSYMQQSYEFFTNANSAEILNGISVDASTVHNIVELMMKMVAELFTAIFIGIFMLHTDAFMALGIMFIVAFCCLLIMCLIKKEISKAGIASRAANMESNKRILQSIQGIRDILLKRKTSFFMRTFIEAREKDGSARVLYGFLSILPERIIEFFCVGGIISIVLIRIAIGADMSSFISSLAIFAVSAFRIMPSISRISGYLSGVIFARPGLEAAYTNICAAKAYTKEQSEELESGELQKNLEFHREIIVSRCTWNYESGSIPVLDEADMIIKRTDCIGIIGESGSGKSTLINMLLGLYKPKSGRITMDGYDIFRIPDAWSRIMGYVPQNVYLLDDTIRANVAFGYAKEEIDDKRVWKALEQANLSTYIKTLSNGLDTRVGEMGVKLSGGQRQRIAIARALYDDPDVLILDEATSALDNETEQSIMEAINRFNRVKTVIMVAHRLTTLKDCNRIYEVRNGKIIERADFKQKEG